MSDGNALLRIEGLRVVYQNSAYPVAALRGVHLQVNEGESVGLTGPSGSGKSTLARTLLLLVPTGTTIQADRLEMEGAAILRMDAERLRTLRGGQIALIPQEPGLALSPFLQVGTQIRDAVQAHLAGQATTSGITLMQRLFGDDADRVWRSYPHQLSTGQLQRVTIALALATRPKLIIADEPTSNIDSIARKELLALLRETRNETGVALLLISHDRDVVRAATDRIVEIREGVANG